MAVALPIYSFIALIVIVFSISSRRDNAQPSLRDAFGVATIVWGLIVFGITEGLSVISAIQRNTLIVVWGGICVALTLYFIIKIKSRFLPRNSRDILRSLQGLGRIEKSILLALSLIVILTAIVAYITPPHEGDSIAYHMGRVVHWSQNQSVGHYAVPDSRHLWMPPWGDYSVLNLYLLSSGDRLVNFVQWFAMVGTMILMSRIADLMGLSTRWQLFSSLFVATLPMGIYQATNALSDYVAAYWVAATAWLVVRASVEGRGWRDWLWLGSLAGLGFLTKGTYVIYAVPFFVWFGIENVKKITSMIGIKRGFGIVLIPVTMAVPYWMRNWISFGSPLGPLEQIQLLSGRTMGIFPFISNLLRNTSLHLVTPLDELNARIVEGVVRIHNLLGLNPSDPALTLPRGGTYSLDWLWPGSNAAPVHFALIIFALSLVWIGKRSASRLARRLTLGAIGGFLLFCILFKWQETERFHISFFNIFAPVVASQLGLRKFRYFVWPATFALILTATPPLLSNRWRPLIGLRPYTAIESILLVPRQDLYFGTSLDKMEDFKETASEIDIRDCKKVGFRMESHEGEYLWWVVLRPEKKQIQIEHLHVFPGLEAYIDSEFDPCAIICTICTPSGDTYRGLTPREMGNSITLFGP